MTSAISGMTGVFRPQVVSGASMRQPPAQRMANLFDAIDTNGSGSISKAQFEQAFQTMNPPKGLQAMGADAIWGQLDPNSSGSVSKQDFVSTMTNVLAQMHAQHAQARADGDGDADGSNGVANGGQGNGSNPLSDLVAVLQKLEATLGGQAPSGQGSNNGTLFNGKA